MNSSARQDPKLIVIMNTYFLIMEEKDAERTVINSSPFIHRLNPFPV